MMGRSCSSLAGLLLAAITFVRAADAKAADSAPTTHVRYDVESRAFSTRLPHGVPFVLDIGAPADAVGALVHYAQAADGKCPITAPAHAIGPRLGVVGAAIAGGTDQVIGTQIDKLDPNTEYCFWITVLVRWSESQRNSFAATLMSKILSEVKQGNPTISKEQVSNWIRTALGDVSGPSDAQVDTAGLADRILAKTYDSLTDTVNATNKYVEQSTYWKRNVRTLAADKEALVKAQLADSEVSTCVQEIDAVLAQELPDSLQGIANPPELAAAAAKVKAAREHTAVLVKKLCSGAVLPEGCRPLQTATSTLGRLEERLRIVSATWSKMAAQWDTFQQLNMRIAMTEPVSRVTLSSPAGFVERAPLYISGSVGAAAVRFQNDGWDVALFVGVNIYFAALDKDKALGTEPAFWRRFSLVAGYTLTGVDSPSGAGRGALGGKGALLGAALRLTDYVQLGAGAALVRQSCTNPLVRNTQLRATPYASLSLDIDVVDIVKGIFSKAR